MTSFLAARTAFSTASCTSLPFATPYPTRPFLSPTSTVARNDICLPPLVTRVTRERSTMVCSNSLGSRGPPFPLPRFLVSCFAIYIKRKGLRNVHQQPARVHDHDIYKDLYQIQRS